MANSLKGDIEFKVDKKIYTLRYSINSMVELEETMGNSIIELANLMSDSNKLSIKNARTLFWAGLRDHHETMTEQEAGRLMDEVGLSESMELMAKAFSLAFPEVPENVPLDQKGRNRAQLIGKAH